MTDADRCEHLEYREAHDGRSFAHERPFCTVVEEFVQPMRADVCAKRYDLDPETDCEYYREHHDRGSVTGFDADAVAGEGGAATGDDDATDDDPTDDGPDPEATE